MIQDIGGADRPISDELLRHLTCVRVTVTVTVRVRVRVRVRVEVRIRDRVEVRDKVRDRAIAAAGTFLWQGWG